MRETAAPTVRCPEPSKPANLGRSDTDWKRLLRIRERLGSIADNRWQTLDPRAIIANEPHLGIE